MDDKKNIAKMLVMGLKPKADPMASDPEDAADGGMDEASEDDSGEPDTMTAAKEIMSALKANDVAGFADALKAFISLSSHDEGESA